MSSSSLKKVFFTSYKKEELLVEIGFMSLFAFNLGLSAYMLLTEPPKRRRDTGETVINDDPEMLPQWQDSFEEDLDMRLHNNKMYPRKSAKSGYPRKPAKAGFGGSGRGYSRFR